MVNTKCTTCGKNCSYGSRLNVNHKTKTWECPTCGNWSPNEVKPTTIDEAFEVIERGKQGAKNNGGETDYYAIKPEWTTHQDVIEARKMNYAQGNIYKVACTFNIGRHTGTDYERELNKIVYFANRELERIKNDE